MAAPSRIQIETKTFRDGLHTSPKESSSRNAVSRLINCWFDTPILAGYKEGCVSYIPKFTVLDTHSTRDVISMYRAEDEAGNIMRLVQLDNGATSAIFQLGADGVIGSALKSSLSTGKLVNYTTVTDPDGVVWIFCCNGAQNPWKIKVSDGTTTDVGLTSGRPDISHVTLSKHADGNVAGVVKYFIAEVASGVEGPLSEGQERDSRSTPDAVKLSFDATTYTDLASKDFAIYRTYAFGVDPFYVGTVEVGASGTTDFIDNVHDDDLGNPPFTHGDPPPSEILDWISYYDRVYGITKDRVYWSDLGQPESFYTASDGNFLRFGFGDGDNGVAITRFGDSFILWSSNHVYQVFGRIPSEFVLKELVPSDGPTKSIGTIDRRSITYTPKGQFFYWEGRIYRLSKSKIIDVSEPVSSLFPWRTSANPTTLAALSYSSYHNLVFVSLASDSGTDEFGNTYLYDPNKNVWVGEINRGYRAYMTDTDSSGITVFRAGGRYAHSSEASLRREIVELEKDSWDDSNGASGFIHLHPFGNPSKLNRFLYVEVRISDEATHATVDLFADIDERSNVVSVTGIPAPEVIGKDIVSYRIYLNGAVGHSLVPRLAIRQDGTSVGDPWRVYSVSVAYQELDDTPHQ